MATHIHNAALRSMNLILSCGLSGAPLLGRAGEPEAQTIRITTVERTPAGGLRIVVDPPPATPAEYLLQTTESLTRARWVPTGLVGTLTGEGVEFVLPIPDTPARGFYRIQHQPASGPVPRTGGYSEERMIETGLPGLWVVDAADFDGDGDLDVVWGSDSHETVAWHENIDGKGTFGPKRLIAVGDDRARHLRTTDLDLDGDQDVVAILTALPDGGEVVWYENQDGRGTFGSEQRVGHASEVNSGLEIGDVDGDGRMDVLGVEVGLIGMAGMTWFENRMDEPGDDFAVWHAIGEPGYTAWATGVDLDGDHDLDTLAAFSQWGVGWNENTGGVNPFSSWRLLKAGLMAQVVAATDIDGDGDQDFVTGGAQPHGGPGWLGWCPNEGSAVFGQERTIDALNIAPLQIVPADLDGDGDQDLLVPSPREGEARWYENLDGRGRFSQQHLIREFSDADDRGMLYGMQAADLNGDGLPEVLTCWQGGELGGWIAWHANNASVLAEPAAIAVTSRGKKYAPRHVHAGDLNGDGHFDVVVPWSAEDSVKWYPYVDGGFPGPSEGRTITANADGAQAVYVADLDGDGDEDVIVGCYNDDTVAWFENLDGAGGFGAAQVLDTRADGLFSIVVADLDKDEDLDILAASYRDDTVGWYQNRLKEASEDFSSRNMISITAGGVEGLRVADLDNDGYLDVLAACYDEDRIVWFQSHLGLSFVERPDLTGLDGAIGVDTGDLDGDGDLDILGCSQNDDKIAWYANRLREVTVDFGPQQVISTAADKPRSVVIWDVDNDGDLDVVSASLLEDTIAWYANDGAGSFGPQQIITTTLDGARYLSLADVDADGDQDLLAVGADPGPSAGPDRVVWLQNLARPKP